LVRLRRKSRAVSFGKDDRRINLEGGGGGDHSGLILFEKEGRTKSSHPHREGKKGGRRPKTISNGGITTDGLGFFGNAPFRRKCAWRRGT